MKLVSSIDELYSNYKSRMRQIADIKNALALLQWDEETYMPSRGAAFRGQQIATLSELAHRLFTDKGFGELLEELMARDNLTVDRQKNIRLSLEDYNKQKKMSPGFVRGLSEAISASFHAWIRARRENSFEYFENDLDKVLQLKKQQADLLGYEAHAYNALLDEYEKGCTVSMLDNTFNQIRQPLKNLFDKIIALPSPEDGFLKQYYPRDQQWEFGISIIKELGFDFEAGRQDLSEHPFTTSFNRNDVRITTRIDENDFSNMLWSCIHETGHALYEQGLEEGEYGLPLGEYASLSIHESQSRIWENNIGRSLPFWEYHYPGLQSRFPAQLGMVSLQDFYRGINKVQPSLIRTEADELSYHFHVIIRYEIEKQLIEGSLSSQDIPAYWNERYRDLLGILVTDDNKGCLQDVHWSHGSFGYFPTYSLGSFYAAQLFRKVEAGYPEFFSRLKKGDSTILLDWLRLNIYKQGRSYKSEELCEKACGEPLNTQYFMKYILDKYAYIYNL